jgi:hypothetical protein
LLAQGGLYDVRNARAERQWKSPRRLADLRLGQFRLDALVEGHRVVAGAEAVAFEQRGQPLFELGPGGGMGRVGREAAW